MPGLFSAVGMLVSGVEHHDVRSCSLLRESLRAETIESLIAEMREPMLAQFRGESYALEEVDFQASVEVRYQGQASQVNLPLEHQPLDAEAIGRLHEQFEAEHERLYGHRSDRDNAVEVVAVRITGRVSSDDRYEFHPPLQPQPTSPARRATFIPPWGSMEVPRVCRQSIVNRAEGPFLIDEYDATIVVPPDMTAEVDNWGNLVLEFRDGGH
jgi:N-methylhydantoinase A